MTGCKVMISRQAQFLIGLDKVNPFVKELVKFMAQVEARTAYVSKSGACVQIYLFKGREGHGED